MEFDPWQTLAVALTPGASPAREEGQSKWGRQGMMSDICHAALRSADSSESSSVALGFTNQKRFASR